MNPTLDSLKPWLTRWPRLVQLDCLFCGTLRAVDTSTPLPDGGVACKNLDCTARLTSLTLTDAGCIDGWSRRRPLNPRKEGS